MSAAEIMLALALKANFLALVCLFRLQRRMDAVTRDVADLRQRLGYPAHV